MKKFGTVVLVPSSFSEPALIAFSSGLPLPFFWWPRVAGCFGTLVRARVVDVVVDVATEEVPSEPERVGLAVVDELVVEELVVDELVEVVFDGVVNPEVVVEVVGGAG